MTDQLPSTEPDPDAVQVTYPRDDVAVITVSSAFDLSGPAVRAIAFAVAG